MSGMREYTLCSPFRANAHNSSYSIYSHVFNVVTMHILKLQLLCVLYLW